MGRYLADHHKGINAARSTQNDSEPYMADVTQSLIFLLVIYDALVLAKLRWGF